MTDQACGKRVYKDEEYGTRYCGKPLNAKGVCPDSENHIVDDETIAAVKATEKPGAKEKAAATWVREADSNKNRAMAYYERAARLYKEAGRDDMYEKFMAEVLKMVIEE